jgi:hypothetical protein
MPVEGCQAKGRGFAQQCKNPGSFSQHTSLDWYAEFIQAQRHV